MRKAASVRGYASDRDASRLWRAHILCDPNGERWTNGIVSSTGTVTPTFGYAGMFRDPSTGLNLTLYRAYDPNLRRWLSRDPIGSTGSGVNLYAYGGGMELVRM